MNAIDRLIDEIQNKNNPSVVGLDTCLEYLPDAFMSMNGSKPANLKDAAQLILQYNIGLIDELYSIVPAVKVQSAYYEMYGYEGVRAFAETIRYAKSKGLVTMADIKRNDIGSTAQAYSNAYLGRTLINGIQMPVFDADFVTLNGYLGIDGIQPFIDDCKKYDKGAFILVKTSNPSSGQLQDLIIDGKPVYEIMGGMVESWGRELVGSSGYSSIGAVTGATYPEQGRRLRQILKTVFFLVPGYGAQGGSLQGLTACFDEKGQGAIVNASRSILCAYKQEGLKNKGYAVAARCEAERMRDDINGALKEAGKAD